MYGIICIFKSFNYSCHIGIINFFIVIESKYSHLSFIMQDKS